MSETLHDGPLAPFGEEWESVEADVRQVFCWSDDTRPQSRAHDYIARREVVREYNDTAMQAAALDMVARAWAAGAKAGRAAVDGGEVEGVCTQLAGELMAMSGRLLRAGTAMGGKESL